MFKDLFKELVRKNPDQLTEKLPAKKVSINL